MTKEEQYIRKLEPYFPGEQRRILEQLIEHAEYLYKSLYRYSGESYLLRALRLTTDKILKLNPDQTMITVSVLINACYSPRCDLTVIKKLFGEEVSVLVESLGKINAIKSRYSSSDTKIIGKMFLTLAKDIRVIIIRLADRIENMETLHFKGLEKQKANAREILEVYVPIASRLGLYEYKLILEDLAFKYVFPEEYKQLKREMDDYLSVSQKSIAQTQHELVKLMKENGFDVSVSGRIKNLFSVFKKLKKKTATLDQIYDIYAMRIVLKTGADGEDGQEEYEKLYKILSLLHSKYDYLSERFKDYVANPKPNGYRSLHTALIGLNTNDVRRPTEVQVRTERMHNFAENGFAAHWIYKESQHMPQDSGLLDALKDLRKNAGGIDPGTAVLKMNLYQDRIFVLTPENLVKELPIGSTPVDFAFAIHSDIGHTCFLAKVNGNVVTLDYQLKSGDIVEIIRSQKINTKLSWLEFVQTKLAKNRIKNYFRTLDKDSLLEQGKDELNALLDKAKLPKLDENLSFLKVYKGKNIALRDRADILEELGAGVINAGIVFKNAFGKSFDGLMQEREKANSLQKKESASVIPAKSAVSVAASLTIGGEKNLPYRIASCCKPKLSDKIVGYISRSKGVVLHKMACIFIQKADATRVLDVKYDVAGKSRDINVEQTSLWLELDETEHRLRDIVDYLDQQKVSIISFSTEKKSGKNLYRRINIDIKDEQKLDKIITELGQINGVLQVSRM